MIDTAPAIASLTTSGENRIIGGPSWLEVPDIIRH